jgi:hypothetical protein
MNLLLAFSPFIAFALLDRCVDATFGLIAGTCVAAGLLARDVLSKDRKIKILEIGTVVLFGALAAYSILVKVDWTIVGVRLCVDAGLLTVVLVSMVVRQPFTLEYAREEVPKEFWSQPKFIQTNYVITAVWAAAFAIMVGADVVMLYVPAVPIKVGIWVTILTLFGAYRFTAWYPERNSG